MPSTHPRTSRPSLAGRLKRGRRLNRVGRVDDGSVTIYFVVTVVAMLLAVGLVGDGARRVQALQRADNTAAEAARAAGQALSPAAVAAGRPNNLDASAAVAAANAYLEAAGVTGDVHSSSVPTPAGTRITITVTTSSPYTPLFIGAPGALTGTATARIVQGTT